MPIDASVRRRWVEVAVVFGVVAMAIALLVPAIEHARETARRAASKNQLRQIGLAILNYEDACQRLPPGAVVSAIGTGNRIVRFGRYVARAHRTPAMPPLTRAIRTR